MKPFDDTGGAHFTGDGGKEAFNSVKESNLSISRERKYVFKEIDLF